MFAASFNHPLSSLGFTLLELLVTLAIVSLLVTISYPIYTQYVIKTYRVQAEVALLDLAAELERYHAVHHTYVGMTSTDVRINQSMGGDIYKLAIQSATEKDYVLKAIPLGAQIQDSACGVLSLNQLGEKGISGTDTVPDCW